MKIFKTKSEAKAYLQKHETTNKFCPQYGGMCRADCICLVETEVSYDRIKIIYKVHEAFCNSPIINGGFNDES